MQCSTHNWGQGQVSPVSSTNSASDQHLHSGMGELKYLPKELLGNPVATLKNFA